MEKSVFLDRPLGQRTADHQALDGQTLSVGDGQALG
jgi:hypothetical protein